jgi:hypothetical protein
VQEYLNRTEHLWGIVTNGLTLRLLRDSTFVRRQAYVEFDLTAILEESRFQDFAALYRLLHRTRLPRGMASADDCLLGQYYAHSVEQGGRVREHLRDGVEECIKGLANGFLRHPANDELRHRVSPACTGNERISVEDLYRQLLRLVYRFLFLLVSEDRGLLSPDLIYREHYSIARLRRLLENRAAYTEHDDLWQSLRVLWKVLSNDTFAALLELAPLNGELFTPLYLDACTMTNRDLLDAFWHRAWYQENPASPPRRVNYAALDVEELGSVYESLLEFHPAVDHDTTGRPEFTLMFGSERKTTGSYYTPSALVNELIQSALEPVIMTVWHLARTSRKRPCCPFVSAILPVARATFSLRRPVGSARSWRAYAPVKTSPRPSACARPRVMRSPVASTAWTRTRSLWICAAWPCGSKATSLTSRSPTSITASAAATRSWAFSIWRDSRTVFQTRRSSPSQAMTG